MQTEGLPVPAPAPGRWTWSYRSLNKSLYFSIGLLVRNYEKLYYNISKALFQLLRLLH